jgi:hypothetical protein
MATLHLTRPAVGCDSLTVLKERHAARARDGEVTITTRYRPKRHEELIGGSLYWIIKHRLVARQRITGFGETEEGRCIIKLDARIVPVRARPKRAHQGWRYLRGEDAPADFDGGEDALTEMPPKMLNELARLALI